MFGPEAADTKVVVGRICEGRTLQSVAREPRHRRIPRAEVYHLPLGQEEDVVESVDDIRRGLVNCEHDDPTLRARKIAQRSHDSFRSE